MTPEEQIESRKAWYRPRLADLSLLDKAVVFEDGGQYEVAVPVGGTRRAGYVNWKSRGAGNDELLRDKIISALSKQPDLFPNLRWENLISNVGEGVVSEECLVRWGVDEKQVITKLQILYNVIYKERDRSSLPAVTCIQLGRLYGFTESAVLQHTIEYLQGITPELYSGIQDDYLFDLTK